MRSGRDGSPAEQLGELTQFAGAVEKTRRIRWLRKHDRARPRRERSLDSSEIEPKRPRIHWHHPRLETKVLQIQRIVEPARGHDEHFATRAVGHRSKHDVERGHGARRQDHVAKVEAGAVARRQRIADQPACQRAPSVRRVLQVERTAGLNRGREGRKDLLRRTVVAVRVGEVAERRPRPQRRLLPKRVHSLLRRQELLDSRRKRIHTRTAARSTFPEEVRCSDGCTSI